ncbi:hypothetical protein P2H44_12795 [Albimonas sp. CAU 1670]|uniref:hypothetical protein n=1 Tax=Albimonas sp. CAU 1670 TaxID=3032599 RepID=UPI0023DBE68E|nr:hypothetical protein [Albimonas sp. CAU 1670]MDF2233431.1 hypothetical protein [Albimonas sp. CAU 1670]
MEFLASVGVALAAGAGIFAVLAAVTWNWDAGLLTRTARDLAQALAAPGAGDGPAERSAKQAAARAASEAFLRAALGPEAPFVRFALRAATASAGALAAMTLIYFLSIPGLPVDFFTDGTSLKLLLRQVALNGFVSAFLVTWASWAVGGAMIPRLAGAGPGRLALHIVFDIAFKLALLCGLSAVIFALFAKVFGSFGGSPAVAVSVVPETIAAALQFRALSGAQVYAALLSGFPWFLLMTLRLAGARPWTAELWRRVERTAPIADRPFRFLGLLLAAFCALSGLAAAQMLRTLRDVSGW